VTDPASYRPAPGSIPESPGVYRFRDEHRRVIYVGKAKSLRSRLNSYFADFAGLHPRTQSMLRAAAGVDWTVVTTEVEALQLEYSWIKEFDPRFNVRYRDDKSYPYLAVTMDEEYPRVMVMRGARRRGVRYFGPYSHAWAIRDTVDTLLRVFPVRTCSAGVFKRSGQIGRPCLLGYIGKCSAPCVGRVDAAEHRHLAEEFCDFMAGQTGKFIRRLEAEMRRAAAAEEYERAARLRDDIQALQRALEKQAVVLGDGTDCDVIALAEDQLEAAVQVFYVRGGRVRGQRGWVVDKVEDITTGELVEHFLGQVYGDDPVAGEPGGADQAQGRRARGERAGAGQPAAGPGRRSGRAGQAGRPGAVPREVLVPVLPPGARVVEEWLAARRGGRVTLRVPLRGDKKALLETVARNAAESLVQHKTKRASDLTTRSRAMAEIQEALGLDDAPLRIECYDVSNLQGTHVVASMIVFEDGLPRKSEYRRFSIHGLDGTDDVASIHEVISRRFRRYLDELQTTGELDVLGDWAGAEQGDLAREPDLAGVKPPGGDQAQAQARPRKFAYPPNLVVIDGGPAQVAAAVRALDELGLDDVAVCGLAKRLEEVWLPGEDGPVIMPRTSEGLYLLQRVRDEAHRFAITYHRKKRSAALTTSELDTVPGLGPARRATLLRHFGSVRRISGATVAEIAGLPGIGPRIAAAVLDALRPAQDGDGGTGRPSAGQRAGQTTGGRAP
jgi:excinuclease ABC subunit C